jgi:hypothetical protein
MISAIVTIPVVFAVAITVAFVVGNCVTPRPAPVPPALQRIQPPCGDVVCWQELLPPTLYCALPPHGDIAPWPVPVPPTPQRIWPPCGNVIHQQETAPPTSQRAPPPHGNELLCCLLSAPIVHLHPLCTLSRLIPA